jgi:hypothetical protein
MAKSHNQLAKPAISLRLLSDDQNLCIRTCAQGILSGYVVGEFDNSRFRLPKADLIREGKMLWSTKTIRTADKASKAHSVGVGS